MLQFSVEAWGAHSGLSTNLFVAPPPLHCSRDQYLHSQRIMNIFLQVCFPWTISKDNKSMKDISHLQLFTPAKKSIGSKDWVLSLVVSITLFQLWNKIQKISFQFNNQETCTEPNFSLFILQPHYLLHIDHCRCS